MTFKPNDPRTLEIARKGAATDNAGRFRKGEPKASIAGRKGRWLSTWNDRSPAEVRRHRRLELINQIARRIR